jgi:hypothetical protein
VSFDSDNAASSHVDVLTREVQVSFKRMDGEIRGMVQPDARDDDAQVRREVPGAGSVVLLRYGT